MLVEKRINEAKSNVRMYLNDGLLKKEEFKSIVYETYVRNYHESLELAENIFKEKRSDLWVVVISYYSMFYIANAVLYKIGYKVGDKIAHKVTSDSIIMFIRDKIKENILSEYEIAAEEALSISDNLLESFDFERSKRSRFQYESTEQIKNSMAKTSLERARKFCFEMEKLLREKK